MSTTHNLVPQRKHSLTAYSTPKTRIPGKLPRSLKELAIKVSPFTLVKKKLNEYDADDLEVDQRSIVAY